MEEIMAHRFAHAGVVSGLLRKDSAWMAAAAVTCIALLACAQMQTDEAPGPLASQGPPPPWAFFLQPPVQPPPDDGVPRHVPGSTVAFSLTQLRDLYTAPDWHPGDHQPLPGVVGRGRKPDLFACGYCHYPNGQGRPENASLAGLSAAYIAQQMADFKNGLRKSSEPAMRPPAFMIANAKSTSDEDVKVAAEYFAGVTYKPWIKVVETETVPKTQVAGFMLAAVDGAGTEPIGQRVIELAQDVARSNLRDPRSGFIAYVPAGSIKRGEALVTTGGRGRTAACATCHGQDLKGMANVPPLAGRSPSYIVRQLFDFQSGARAGLLSAPMKETVAKLTLEDMVAIAAYAASRSP
jgi:cytochrome c553